MPFHCAKIENSSRLQRLLVFLSDFNWHTNREIFEKTGIHAYSTACSELRHNGFPVEQRSVKGEPGLHEYRLSRPERLAA